MENYKQIIKYNCCSNDFFQRNDFGKMFALGMPTYFFDINVINPTDITLVWNKHCKQCVLYKVIVLSPEGRVIKSKQRQKLRHELGANSFLGYLNNCELKLNEDTDELEFIEKKISTNDFDKITFRAKTPGEYRIKYWADFGYDEMYTIHAFVKQDNSIDLTYGGQRVYNDLGSHKDGAVYDEQNKIKNKCANKVVSGKAPFHQTDLRKTSRTIRTIPNIRS